MTIHPCPRGLALAACLTLLSVAPAARSEAPTAAPALSYRSAFADYKPYQDVPRANWPAVNRAVAAAPGAASGHAGHPMAGLNSTDAPAAPTPPAGAPVPVPPPMRMPPHHGQNTPGDRP